MQKEFKTHTNINHNELKKFCKILIKEVWKNNNNLHTTSHTHITIKQYMTDRPQNLQSIKGCDVRVIDGFTQSPFVSIHHLHLSMEEWLKSVCIKYHKTNCLIQHTTVN